MKSVAADGCHAVSSWALCWRVDCAGGAAADERPCSCAAAAAASGACRFPLCTVLRVCCMHARPPVRGELCHNCQRHWECNQLMAMVSLHRRITLHFAIAHPKELLLLQLTYMGSPQQGIFAFALGCALHTCMGQLIDIMLLSGACQGRPAMRCLWRCCFQASTLWMDNRLHCSLALLLYSV